MSPLLSAENDALEMERVLSDLGFDTIVKTNLNRYDMGNEIFKFARKIKDYDSCLFYYAGHGFEVENENILIPIDLNYQAMGNNQELIFNAFKLQDLINQFNIYPEKVKILIIDACRRDVNIRGISNGFVAMSAPKGTILAFSTSPGEAALEDNFSRHGKYTKCLLDHINEKNIPIEVVFKQVRKEMDLLTNGRQLPWEHTSLIGEYYFNQETEINNNEPNYVYSAEITYKQKEKETKYENIQKVIKTEWRYPYIKIKETYANRENNVAEFVNSHISEIYKNVESEWEEWHKNNFETKTSEPCSDGLGYEVLLNQAGILCIRFSRYIYTGGFHGIPVWIIKTFDLNECRELQLKDFIPLSEKSIIKKIQDRFAEEKQIHQTERPTISPDFELDEYHKLTDYKWYIDENGIHIYFDIYEASSYSEGFINFLLTDQIYLQRNNEYHEVKIEKKTLIRKAVNELISLYEDRYSIRVNQTIGGRKYDVIAYSLIPSDYHTFWTIKCMKFSQYKISYLKTMIEEMVTMKQSLEKILERQVIAELYIIWDEEIPNDVEQISKRDFEDFASQYDKELHLQFDCKKKCDIQLYAIEEMNNDDDLVR